MTHRTPLCAATLAVTVFLAAPALPLPLIDGSPIAAESASAGTYDVFACDPGQGNAATPAFGKHADPGAAAYDACNGNEGMIARNAIQQGGSIGFLQGAYQIFDAPDGATVESIAFDARLERPDCRWALQLVAGGRDLGGRVIWGLGAESDQYTCSIRGSQWHRWDYPVNAPRVRFEARCGAGACGRSTLNAVYAKNVRVRVRDDSAPVIADVRGGLWSETWLRGANELTFDASDNVGIRETSVKVDGRTVSYKGKTCDPTQRAPCPNGGETAQVPTSAIADGAHSVSVEAVDSAGNRAEVSHRLLVDNTPPKQPIDLAVEGGEGWRAVNDFDLRWRDPVEPGVAPIAGAEVELCPAAGGASCTRRSFPVAELGAAGAEQQRALKDLRLPSAGEWVARLWLRDQAGNQDERTAGTALRLRLDDQAPELGFEAPDPADPTRLVARATDAVSGVARGQIEVRRRGRAAWQPLPTVLEQGQLTARLDDEALPNGTYDIRALAADHAGNERTSQARTDGQQAELTLPVRLLTTLRAGVVRRSGKRRRTRYAKAFRVGYRSPARFRGRLTTVDRNPVQDAEILVFAQERRDGAAMQQVATVKTSRRGAFSYRAPKGTSRTIRFRYAGTPTVRAATRNVALLVKAHSTLRPNRRAFVNGETVRFRGRLSGRAIPAQGKLIELQVLLRGRYRTFATARTDRNGRWYYDYRFDGTNGAQTYRFRVQIPREANYPYDTGRSRGVKVQVNGL